MEVSVGSLMNMYLFMTDSPCEARTIFESHNFSDQSNVPKLSIVIKLCITIPCIIARVLAVIEQTKDGKIQWNKNIFYA